MAGNVEKSNVKELLNTVVSGDYCIGCGACASLEASPIRIELDQYGKFQASLDENGLNSDVKAQEVCPFSDRSLNEDQIGMKLFYEQGKYREKLGFVIATYAGYVSEGNFRERGSSGGIGTWVLVELIKRGLVDNVIHVLPNSPSPSNPNLFQYEISRSIEQACNGAKSRYYPVQMSDVLKTVRRESGSYAIVGIPCFIKAVRLLALHDPIIAERIRFCIGLVCGYLPSTKFAEMFSWQCGIKPDNMLAIDFRKKLPGSPASKYGVEVTGKGGDGNKKITVPFGVNWGRGFFKYNACDYCDDVVGETADISVGDAWLPKYVGDSRGTSIVVVRNPEIHELIQSGMKEGRLNLETTSAEEVIQSQSSAFRHRRDGLAYRLYLKDRKGVWRPNKRVQPNAYRFNFIFKKIHESRMDLARESHLAYQEVLKTQNPSVFFKHMNLLVRRYQLVQLLPFLFRQAKKYLAR